MSASIDKIVLELKGPKFNKKLTFQLCCGVAKPEAIDDYKKTWSTLEDICVELDKFTQDQYVAQYPNYFKPENSEDVKRAVIAIDGKEREVMFVGILIIDGVAVLKRLSAMDELRMMARRSTLFFQNFKKMNEKQYAEQSGKIRKWAMANFEDWKKLKSGEIESEEKIYGFYYYLHNDNDFENPICEIKMPEIIEKEPSVDGMEPIKKVETIVSEEAALGFAGMLGLAGITVDTGPAHGEEEEELEVVELEYYPEDECYLDAAKKLGIEFEQTDGLKDESFGDHAYPFMEILNKSINLALGGDLSDDDEDGEEELCNGVLDGLKDDTEKDQTQQDDMPGSILDAMMQTNTVFDTMLADNSDAIFADFQQSETNVQGKLSFMDESAAMLDMQEMESPLTRMARITEENEAEEAENAEEETPAEGENVTPVELETPAEEITAEE